MTERRIAYQNQMESFCLDVPPEAMFLSASHLTFELELTHLYQSKIHFSTSFITVLAITSTAFALPSVEDPRGWQRSCSKYIQRYQHNSACTVNSVTALPGIQARIANLDASSRRNISSPLVARKFCPWCRKVFPKITPVIVKLGEVGIICS